MVVIIILVVLLTALYQVFSGGQKGANEAMQNHIINEEAQKLVDFLTNDIREACGVDPNLPQLLSSAEVSNLKSDDPNNKLFFTKYEYDFSKNPTMLADGQVNYTQTKILYFVEKKDLSSATSSYVLIRKMTPWDDMRKAKGNEIKIRPISDKLESFVFYRLLPLPLDSRGMGARNVFFKFLLTRRDKNAPINQKYSAEINTSVAIRGEEPE
ncbi:hypothetical protein HYY75_06345 [bacterium]|nr:hypothetical protein [bacterium]